MADARRSPAFTASGLRRQVRSNTWDTSSLQVEEHFVEVEQTRGERTLYLQQQNHVAALPATR